MEYLNNNRDMIKKAEVLQLLADGHPLIRVFYPKGVDYQIDRRKVHTKTAEALILGGSLKLGKMDFNGLTKHYYFMNQ